MSDKIEYSRLILKRSDVSGVTPTVTSATTLNNFTETDLFSGEMFLNTVDERAFVRMNNSILEFDLVSSGGTDYNFCSTGIQTSAISGCSSINVYENLDITSGFGVRSLTDTTSLLNLNYGGNSNTVGVQTESGTITDNLILDPDFNTDFGTGMSSYDSGSDETGYLYVSPTQNEFKVLDYNFSEYSGGLSILRNSFADTITVDVTTQDDNTASMDTLTSLTMKTDRSTQQGTVDLVGGWELTVKGKNQLNVISDDIRLSSNNTSNGVVSINNTSGLTINDSSGFPVNTVDGFSLAGGIGNTGTGQSSITYGRLNTNTQNQSAVFGSSIVASDSDTLHINKISFQPLGDGVATGSWAYVELEIGDWDMDTNATTTVAHSLSSSEWKTVRNYQAIVRRDDDTQYYGLYTQIGAQGVSSWGATQFNLERDNSGEFDNANFSSTGYNRGWIGYWYQPD